MLGFIGRLLPSVLLLPEGKLCAGRLRAKRLANELDESLALFDGLAAVVRLPDLRAVFRTWCRANGEIVSHGLPFLLDQTKVLKLGGQAVDVIAEHVSKLSPSG